MRYSSWDMEWETNFFVISGHFLPFYPPSPPPHPGNQNSAKMKKASGDVIILHVCTKNHNHIWCMLYEIWSAIEINFFVILGHFLPFYPPKNKNQFFFKKAPGNVIILHNCTIDDKYMIYFLLILDQFLPFYPTNNPINQNFWKMKKNLEISCYTSAPKIMIICNNVSKIWCVCVCVCV